MSLRDELPTRIEPMPARENPLRAELAELVADYLERGGTITEVPPGICAESATAPRQAFRVSPNRPSFDD